ncbi:MAG: Ig-like domain-containing protein [Clostridia bacterium]|nr:Ig-like domain-containing protein [Clostridia bacterium]
MKWLICLALAACLCCVSLFALAEDMDGWAAEAPVPELGPIDLTDDELVIEAMPLDLFLEGEAIAPMAAAATEVFPDEVFCRYVVDSFDLNGDGAISSAEAKKVKTIDVTGLGVASLEGIAQFTKLTTLLCADNLISALDVSGNKSLTTLLCDENPIEALEFGKNTTLSKYVKSSVPKMGEGCVYYEKKSGKNVNVVLSVPDTARVTVKDEVYYDPEEELVLTDDELTVGVKQKFSILSEETGYNIAYLTFETSDKKVATVTKKGMVTAVKGGEATITVTAFDGTVAECALTVIPAPTKVTLPVKKLTLGVGETYALEPTFQPENCQKTYTWKSNKEQYATVEDGVVTGVAPGKANITIKTFNSKSATCAVTVMAAPETITLNAETLGLMQYQTYALKATLNKGAGGTMTMYSDAPDIVDVDPATGVLTANGLGETTIRVETYNGVTAACAVSVMPGPASIVLSDDALSMVVGSTHDLEPVALTDDGQDVSKVLAYKSSNEKVVSVSNTGELTANKAGTVTITVSAANGKVATCKVTVGKAPTSISLSRKTLKLKYDPEAQLGDEAEIKATMNSGAVSVITFESDDPSVVALEQTGAAVATLIARDIGTATITATTSNGKVATCAVTVVDGTAKADPYGNGVIVVAHRGGLSGGPENTLKAFRSSASYGADMIELDVRTTKDGILVINHDPKIGGKTIKSTKYADLLKKKSNLCTFDEALDVIYDSGLLLQVELKDTADVTKTVAAVRAHDMEDRVYYISFEKSLLRQVRKLEPDARLGFIFMDSVPSKLDDFIDELDISALMVHYKLLSQKRLDDWHAQGLLINVWTINSSSECKYWIDMGVDFITSNYPEYADRVRN